jgi:hypothetical protein
VIEGKGVLSKAECGTDGQWSVTFQIPTDLTQFEMRFEDKNTGSVVGRKTFDIK